LIRKNYYYFKRNFVEKKGIPFNMKIFVLLKNEKALSKI